MLPLLSLNGWLLLGSLVQVCFLLFVNKLRTRIFRSGIHFSKLSTCGLLVKLFKSVFFDCSQVRTFSHAPIALHPINFMSEMICQEPFIFICVENFGPRSVRKTNKVNKRISLKVLICAVQCCFLNLNQYLFATGRQLLFYWFFHHDIKRVSQVFGIGCVCELFA